MSLTKTSWRRHWASKQYVQVHLRSYPHWHEADFWLVFYPHSNQPPPQLKTTNFLKFTYNIIMQGLNHDHQWFLVDVADPSKPIALLLYPTKQLLNQSVKPFWLDHGAPNSHFLNEHPIKTLGVYLPDEMLTPTTTQLAQFLSGLAQISDSLRSVILLTTPKNHHTITTQHGDIAKLEQLFNTYLQAGDDETQSSNSYVHHRSA